MCCYKWKTHLRDYIITVNPLFSLLLKSSFCMFVSCPFKITQLLKTIMLITSVQSFSCVRLFATPWSAARQAFLSITKSWSSLRLTSIESVAIQPYHPLSCPSPPAFNLFQHKGLFKWVSSSHQVARVLEFQLQHQSFQWIFRTDFL